MPISPIDDEAIIVSGLNRLTINQGQRPIEGEVPVTFDLETGHNVTDLFLVVNGVIIKTILNGALGDREGGPGALRWDTTNLDDGQHTVAVYAGSNDAVYTGVYVGDEETLLVGAATIISYALYSAPLVPVTTAMYGTRLLIYGSNFGEDTGTVYFGSVLATVNSWSDTVLDVDVPAQASYPNVGPVYVTRADLAAVAGPNFTTTGLLGPCGQPYVEGQAIVLVDATTYLSRPTSADLNTPAALSVWVRFNGSVPANAFIMGKWHNSDTAQQEWKLWWQSAAGRFRFDRRNGSGSTESVLNSSFTVLADTWYHVWVQLAGSTMTMFVDNAHGDSNAFSGIMETNKVAFRLGVSADGAHSWSGYVAQATILNLPAVAANTRAAFWNSGAGIRYDDLGATYQGEVASHYELDETLIATSCCDWKGSNHLTKNGTINTIAGII